MKLTVYSLLDYGKKLCFLLRDNEGKVLYHPFQSVAGRFKPIGEDIKNYYIDLEKYKTQIIWEVELNDEVQLKDLLKNLQASYGDIMNEITRHITTGLSNLLSKLYPLIGDNAILSDYLVQFESTYLKIYAYSDMQDQLSLAEVDVPSIWSVKKLENKAKVEDSYASYLEGKLFLGKNSLDMKAFHPLSRLLRSILALNPELLKNLWESLNTSFVELLELKAFISTLEDITRKVYNGETYLRTLGENFHSSALEHSKTAKQLREFFIQHKREKDYGNSKKEALQFAEKVDKEIKTYLSNKILFKCENDQILNFYDVRRLAVRDTLNLWVTLNKKKKEQEEKRQEILNKLTN